MYRTPLNFLLLVVLIGLTTAEPAQQEQEIEHFVTYYYLNPQPERAAEVLKVLFQSPMFLDMERCDEHCRNLIALSFGLIGQDDPDVANQYLEMFEAGKHDQRLLLLDVLKICRNDTVESFFKSRARAGRFGNEREEIDALIEGITPQFFENLNNPIMTAEDIDYRWTAYFIRGNKAYIKEIVQILIKQDTNAESTVVIAAAKWSLQANCQQHESILSICEEEFIRSEGTLKDVLAKLLSGIKGEDTKKVFDKKTILEERARKLLNIGDVSLRKDVDVLFELAAIYVKEGKDKEAIDLYRRALQADSWRLEKQLEFGKLIAKGYDRDLAKDKALFVFEYAEDDALISEAQSLMTDLGADSVYLEPTANKVVSDKIEIVIVPIGNINKILLNEIRIDLQNTLGITYTISGVGLDLGHADRNRVEQHIDETIEKIKAGLSPEKLGEFLAELDLSESDLNGLDGKKSY